MTDRRLPPALEEKAIWGQVEVSGNVYAESDLRDWLYGKNDMIMSENLHYVKHKPGLVERVLKRADSLYLSESDVAGPVMSSADYLLEALRAELGMEEA